MHPSSTTRARASAAVSALLLLPLVACRPVSALEPTIAYAADSGLCGLNIVVDLEWVLWKERGCENGVPRARRVRRLTAKERDSLAAALARLPDRDTITSAEASPVLEAFTLLTRVPALPCRTSSTIRGRDADGRLREWALETHPSRDC